MRIGKDRSAFREEQGKGMAVNRFWMERLFVNRQLSTHVLDQNGVMTDRFGIGEKDEDPFVSDAKLTDWIRIRQQEKGGPLLLLEDGWILYFAFEDREKNLYIAGPASTVSGTELRSGLMHYRKKHQLAQRYLNIPHITLTEAANLLSMSVYALTGEETDESGILTLNEIPAEQMEKDLTNYRFETVEQEKRHVEYAYEKEYVAAIRNGDVDYFTRPIGDKVHMTDEVGKLAEKGLKQTEYTVAAGLTLASRAAMEGGIAPATAYAVSEVFFQKLEKCRTPVEMFQLHREIQYEYVSMVARHKAEKKNAYYIEQCKDYLTQNIHHRISVAELAEKVGLNRTYLSGKFTEQVGMSISQYSILVRLRAAENMLKYSGEPISVIADYLCFSSQSHFGREFKKKNGISPAQYRRRNQNSYFTEKQTKIAK